MANIISINSSSVELEGNATINDVLNGVTFYSNNPYAKQTGTLELTGNATPADVISGKTFYNTNAKTKQTGNLLLSGTATVSDVIAGKTFYNLDAKQKMTGTLNNIYNGYQIKTGSIAASTANANPNIIPICCTVSMSQVAGTAWGSVRYGSTTVASFRQFEGTGSLQVFMGSEAMSLVKKSITATNASLKNVTAWFEKSGDPYPGYTIQSGSKTWSGSLPSNIVPLVASVTVGGSQWTSYPATAYVKDNLGTTYLSYYVNGNSSGTTSGSVDIAGLYGNNIEKLKQVKSWSASGSQSPYGAVTLTIWLEANS